MTEIQISIKNHIECPCLSCTSGKQAFKDVDLLGHATRWQKFQNDLASWSDKTFGGNRPPERSFSHLEEELGELRADPTDLKEYADCFLLLIDCCRRSGHNMEAVYQACADKLEVCKKRKWGKADASGKVNHVPGT
jgi:hypothetical protein